MTAELLVIHKLSVAYGGSPVLVDLSLRIAAGEVLGLLGPNGAGKTSLVRAVTGAVKPVSGSIHILGKPLLPGRAHHHSIGFAPQSLGLYKQLTGRENLQVFARLSGIRRAARAQTVCRALEEIDLTQRADERVSRMSGGMQRRIHVAATLLNHPHLIILDEPTAGVDLEARQLINDIARRRAADGAAVMLVTHELAEAEQLCQRVVVLDRGRQVAEGAPAQLIEETFAGAQRFTIRSASAPSPKQRRQLSGLGFSEGTSATEWQANSKLSAEELLKQLQQSEAGLGMQIQEFSVRRPDLSELMRALTEAQPR